MDSFYRVSLRGEKVRIVRDVSPLFIFDQMIDIDIVKKRRGASANTASGNQAVAPGTTDYAVRSGHADMADRAERSGVSDNAIHAQSSKELDSSSSVWQKLREMFGDLSDKYLRKDVDDTASGLISFLKGLSVGGAGKYGISKEGVGKLLQILADSGVIAQLTSEEASIKNLTVTGAAHFFRLVIDEIKASGGSVLVTPANGFEVAKVEKDGDDYRLYFRADDGERAVTNKWKVGMQAVSMSFNAAKGESMDAGNHYWWALVTAVSAEAVSPEWDSEHKYHWVEVSSTDTAYGSTVPQTGDEVAQLGYRIQGDNDPELRTYTDGDGTTHQYCPLQSAIYLSAYDSIDNGLVAPFLAFYRGINDFDLGSHRKTYFDAARNMLVGDVYNISSMIEDVVLSKPVIGYEITCKVNGVAADTVSYDAVKASANSSIEFDFYKHGEPYDAPHATIGCYDKDGLLQGELIDITDAFGSVLSAGDMHLQSTTKTIVCTLYDSTGAKVKERGVSVVRDGAKGVDACYIRVTSTAGPAYKNHVINTTLECHVYLGAEDVTDRCDGAGFTWYYGVSTTAYSTGTNTITLSEWKESNDASKWRCVYEGEVAPKSYVLSYGGKNVTYGGKMLTYSEET